MSFSPCPPSKITDAYPAGVILSGAVLQAERRISPLECMRGPSLAPLETTRVFGMTPVFMLGCEYPRS